MALATAFLTGCAAQVHHENGTDALEAGDYPRAVQELAQASKLAPGDLAYRRDALRVRETANEALSNTAADALAAGERQKAEQAYATILKYDPANARALAGLEALRELALADEDVKQARVELGRGDQVHANELIVRALKRAPGHVGAKGVRRELDALQAQQSMIAPSLDQVYRKPINLEFRDTSIKLVFDALSRTTGINFIFDRDVRPDQRTTVFLKQTSLDDAIDVILSTGQLEKKVLNPSSVLIYPSTPAKLREYQDLMVRAFYLANVEAKQAATMLKTVLKLKDVYVDDKYNLLVLRESPETIGLAEKLIRLQDLEEPEVMLEVEVLEINRSRLLNAGIQWSSQLTVAPLSGSGAVPGSGTSTATMKLSDLKSLTSNGLGITVPSATINLQKTDGDANLLANPRIRVRDREKAKILIGDKVPVVTTTSTNNFVTENIQYLDVGLKLEVEPDIHLRDEVGLKLSLEVSSLVSSVKTNNGSQAYQIGTRNFSSALRLRDGETQILAGLISDEDRSSANRIPLIGQLPVLGRLFGSQSDTRQKTEIVLSITPRLIRNIHRQTPAAESFWSGTEAVLRDRPLQLRAVTPDGAAGTTPAAAAGAPVPAPVAPAAALVTPASGPDAPRMTWEGPAAAKVGEPIQLFLSMDSPEMLRAASLQVAFNPAEFELVSLTEAGYFGKEKATFSKSVDVSGRASVGIKAPDDQPVKGTGRVLALTLKPLAANPGASVSLIAMTPIGANKSVGRPALPAAHKIAVAQ
ncbi:secretin N-terminal domain-containing protein [Massilia sp. BKSP1R2A-1]|uniref:secretin N-terminal domain-containing protein n=1 Tax=Massilia sp. BKSP1R2A-1 TaxID=3422595 RepID=UPI003D343A42